MCSVFQFIVFINTFLFQTIVGNIVTVGDYPELNPRTCGLSRLRLGVATNLCLEWHKEISSPVRGGTEVRGDAPWVALLHLFDRSANYKHTCSGSVIADQWILTTAHCLEPLRYTIKVNLGPVYHWSNEKPFDETDKYYIHPEYSNGQGKLYDIGLVKMTKPINTSADLSFVNSICLPQKWSPIYSTDCHFKPTPNCKPTEYGMVSGWGSGSYNQERKLQMGYWRLHNIRWTLNNDSITPSKETRAGELGMTYVGEQRSCKGDGGAPVWQYDMGRAVIIGIRSAGYYDNMECEEIDQKSNYSSFAMFVDEEIDWITSTIQNN